jgi:hypothetical protein
MVLPQVFGPGSINLGGDVLPSFNLSVQCEGAIRSANAAVLA